MDIITYLKMTQLERDILTEILNISLAKAADSFAKITHETVLINVPDVALLQEETALDTIIKKRNIDLIVQSEIKGDIYGQTLLLFTNQQIDDLGKISLNNQDSNDNVLRHSLLLEISNILTGTLVTHLANILKLNIYGSVPKEPISRKQIRPEQLIIDLDVSRPILVTINTLFLRMNSSMQLPLMLIFDVPNLNKILEIVRKINTDNKLLLRK